MSIYDIKLEARAALHEAMQRPGFCYSEDGSFRVVDVRVHTEYGALGDVKGTSFIYAEMRDVVKAKLIFLNAQYRPQRGDVVMLTSVEGYRVDNVDPPYNITTDGMVSPLPKKELPLYVAPPSLAVYSPMAGYLPVTAAAAITSPLAVIEDTGLLATSESEVA